MTEVQKAENADQVAYWNSTAGERWAALQTRLDALFAPLTTALLAFAAPRPGSAVLDIGCGTGATVLALAAAVGPTGRVLGVDVSSPMLAVASGRAASAGVANAELLLADAAAHAFAPGYFDLAFSRFGVMFFADPVAAFINIRHALAPEGRLAFACWQPLAANSWFAVPMGALRPLLLAGPTADPLAPGPFAFADPERVRTLLAGAGFRDVAIQPHQTQIGLGDREAALELLSQVGPASRLLGDADPEARPGLLGAIGSALARHDGSDGVVLDGAIWLVSARVA